MSDPFRPPSVPVEVHCIHCNNEYESYLIAWREELCQDGKTHGFWCCPIPGCDGRGFGFDIFPTDPDYVDENTGEKMWIEDDDDEDDDAIEDGDDSVEPDAGFDDELSDREASQPDDEPDRPSWLKRIDDDLPW